MNIRVTAAELERSHQSSVQLSESEGYFAWMGAFHQLHCIVRIAVVSAMAFSNGGRILFGAGSTGIVIMRTFQARRMNIRGNMSVGIFPLRVAVLSLSPACRADFRGYTDRCLDLVRQTTMCHADTTLTTFVWDPNKSKPMFNASESLHTCIDWKAFVSSFSDRAVTDDEIARLQNPLMESVR